MKIEDFEIGKKSKVVVGKYYFSKHQNSVLKAVDVDDEGDPVFKHVCGDNTYFEAEDGHIFMFNDPKVEAILKTK